MIGPSTGPLRPARHETGNPAARLSLFLALSYALTWAAFISVARWVPVHTGAGYALVLFGAYAPGLVALMLTFRSGELSIALDCESPAGGDSYHTICLSCGPCRWSRCRLRSRRSAGHVQPERAVGRLAFSWAAVDRGGVLPDANAGKTRVAPLNRSSRFRETPDLEASSRCLQ